ncbi:hypothetical protein AN401_07295 [Zobellella denitrificans]|uniref:Uncharacterized protein n=1 Tax=Zobellella denitrificans TaxID=347534 RepID=A0A291HNN0_9GAMM|nr:hypothetical protein [Zobellella denitrificans]ATG73688.1 hypothetical protein AN401_07295 [Zobellella denitrificans]
MAKFFRNFQGDAIDAAPVGWTNRWVTSGTWAVRFKQGKMLENSGTPDARRALSYDAPGSPTDVELLTRFRTSNQSGTNQQGLLFARGAGAAGSETGYRVWVNATQIALGRFVSGTATTITTASFSAAANVWYRVRFRVNGTSLRVRIWAEGTTEPGTWNIDTTDSNIASGGWCGVHAFESDGVRDWLWLSVGTAGDTADDPPADGEARVSQKTVEVLGTVDMTPAGEARVSQVTVEVLGRAPLDANGEARVSQKTVEVLANAEPQYIDGTVRLNWQEINTLEEEHRVYFSTSPMDPEALPAPVAVLGPDVVTYDYHNTFVVFSYAYFRVSAVTAGGAIERVSDELRVLIQ